MQLKATSFLTSMQSIKLYLKGKLLKIQCKSQVQFSNLQCKCACLKTLFSKEKITKRKKSMERLHATIIRMLWDKSYRTWSRISQRFGSSRQYVIKLIVGFRKKVESTLIFDRSTNYIKLCMLHFMNIFQTGLLSV